MFQRLYVTAPSAPFNSKLDNVLTSISKNEYTHTHYIQKYKYIHNTL